MGRPRDGRYEVNELNVRSIGNVMILQGELNSDQNSVEYQEEGKHEDFSVQEMNLVLQDAQNINQKSGPSSPAMVLQVHNSPPLSEAVLVSARSNGDLPSVVELNDISEEDSL